ncbi:hypothetical protein [Halorubrum xinjiangense]|nr:hypothetical protein [Halorubrum xinjiangense]
MSPLRRGAEKVVRRRQAAFGRIDRGSSSVERVAVVGPSATAAVAVAGP